MKIVIVTPKARRDLKAIGNYIGQSDLDAADTVISDILDAIGDLAASRKRGHPRLDLPSKYLAEVVGSYVIVHRIDDAFLHVIRVVHGARDFRRLL